MKVIVGLGNPGEEYKLTRHNAGFMAVDALAEKLTVSWEKSSKYRAHLAKAGDLLLIKPQTYMNLSGQAVEAVLSYYHLLPKTLGLLKKKQSDLSAILTVIHDDLDINLGQYKISVDSRSAGHKGVESIIKCLKTKNFRRLRIGLKTNLLSPLPAEKYVLQKFKTEEIDLINKVIREITDKILPRD